MLTKANTRFRSGPSPRVSTGRVSARLAWGDWPAYTLLLVASDLVAMAGAGALVGAAGLGELWPTSNAAGSPISYIALLAIMAPLWVVSMSVGGCYERSALGVGYDEYRRVFDTAVRYLAALAVVAFALDIQVSRGFVAAVIPSATGLSFTLRYLARRWLHGQRKLGRFMESALVVGSQDAIEDVIGKLERAPFAGLKVTAVCVAGVAPPTGRIYDISIAGDERCAPELAVELGCQSIIIADTTTFKDGALRQFAWRLEGTGVGLLVVPGIADLSGPRISVRPASDLPLLALEEPEFRGWRRATKSIADRVIAGIGLVVLAPVLVLIALAVRLSTDGPAIFRQRRVGLDGRLFTLWKFRTMVIGAESMIDDLHDRNEHEGLLFKIYADPRVTRIGRVLRQWSLDELPQLWNVLRGEMSLVGPRPPLPSEVERYGEMALRRLLVKPGMTGLWQVSGRSGLSWEEAIRLDLHYVENWSPSLDAIIMLRTITAVLRCRGAY